MQYRCGTAYLLQAVPQRAQQAAEGLPGAQAAQGVARQRQRAQAGHAPQLRRQLRQVVVGQVQQRQRQAAGSRREGGQSALYSMKRWCVRLSSADAI